MQKRVHVLIPGPVHFPSPETVNEQLRRAEILPTDTQEYMKDIHSAQGERGEGARVTGRGRESTKGEENDRSDITLFRTVFIFVPSQKQCESGLWCCVYQD